MKRTNVLARRLRVWPGAAMIVFASALAVWPQTSASPQRPALSGPAAPSEAASLAEAQRLMDKERFHEAEVILRATVAGAPRSGPASYLLAYALLRQDRPREALEQYTRAAAVEAPSAEDLKNAGQAYVLLDDYADAAKWIDRAAEMDPKDPEIWYALGRLRYSEQKYTEAAGCFRKTLLLAPRNVKAENNLGLAYEGLDLPDDAIAAYRQAIAWQEADPSNRPSEQPLLNLSIALIHRGDLSGAGPLLLRAVAIAPEDPRVREQLGHLDLQQGNFNEAAAQLETAVRLDPKRSELHFLLGQAYRHLGRAGEAKEQFDLAGRLANQLTHPGPK